MAHILRMRPISNPITRKQQPPLNTIILNRPTNRPSELDHPPLHETRIFPPLPNFRFNNRSRFRIPPLPNPLTSHQPRHKNDQPNNPPHPPLLRLLRYASRLRPTHGLQPSLGNAEYRRYDLAG